MPLVLGVNWGGIQPGACLLRDGAIVVAIEEERLTRVKQGILGPHRWLWLWYNLRWGYFPWASVTYCLRTAGVLIDQLDAVVVSRDTLPFGVAWESFLPIHPDKLIVQSEPVGASHHFRHALSAFYASPFDSAAVLVLDPVGSEDTPAVPGGSRKGGEGESAYLFEDRSGAYQEVFKNRYETQMTLRAGAIEDPARWGGIGMMSLVVSTALGFRDPNTRLDSGGRTVALAAHGSPSPEFADPWISDKGSHLDFSRFHQFAQDSHLFDLPPGDPSAAMPALFDARARNLAHKVQLETERAMVHLAERLRSETGATCLCLAGGTALNGGANNAIVSRGIFEHVFVQPAADDDGQAIGLAYYGHLKLSREPIKPMRHAFAGRSYSNDEIRILLDSYRLGYRELSDEGSLPDHAAADLATSRIVAWFQGGSEFGPHALGHRSILADPRRAEMKEQVSARAKFRETYRPFGASVLAERATEIFDLRGGESPYMLITAPVRNEWLARIPAVTHVDATCRIHTVSRDTDPLYHCLLEGFSARTGVPVLLNTSFNLAGLPIVESPRDALQCFLFSETDALYLNHFRVEQPPLSALFPQMNRLWELVAPASSPGELLFSFTPMKGGQAKPKSVVVPAIQGIQMERLCAGMDGVRSLEQLLEEAGPEALHDSDRAAQVVRFVKRALRENALHLRFGSDVL